jgi:hypothetical protein
LSLTDSHGRHPTSSISTNVPSLHLSHMWCCNNFIIQMCHTYIILLLLSSLTNSRRQLASHFSRVLVVHTLRILFSQFTPSMHRFFFCYWVVGRQAGQCGLWNGVLSYKFIIITFFLSLTDSHGGRPTSSISTNVSSLPFSHVWCRTNFIIQMYRTYIIILLLSSLTNSRRQLASHFSRVLVVHTLQILFSQFTPSMYRFFFCYWVVGRQEG